MAGYVLLFNVLFTVFLTYLNRKPCILHTKSLEVLSYLCLNVLAIEEKDPDHHMFECLNQPLERDKP